MPRARAEGITVDRAKARIRQINLVKWLAQAPFTRDERIQDYRERPTETHPYGMTLAQARDAVKREEQDAPGRIIKARAEAEGIPLEEARRREEAEKREREKAEQRVKTIEDAITDEEIKRIIRMAECRI